MIHSDRALCSTTQFPATSTGFYRLATVALVFTAIVWPTGPASAQRLNNGNQLQTP
jgi:hypothetical protein